MASGCRCSGFSVLRVVKCIKWVYKWAKSTAAKMISQNSVLFVITSNKPQAVYKDGQHESSQKVKPKHTDCHLVVGCGIRHDPPPPPCSPLGGRPHGHKADVLTLFPSHYCTDSGTKLHCQHKRIPTTHINQRYFVFIFVQWEEVEMPRPSLFKSKGGTSWMIQLTGCLHVLCVSALGDRVWSISAFHILCGSWTHKKNVWTCLEKTTRIIPKQKSQRSLFKVTPPHVYGY